MTKNSRIFAVTLFAILSVSTAMALPVNFATATPTSSTPQFTILNTGGTVSITATGQDFFTFLVSGTPFAGPVLADFSLTATSTQFGACGSVGCPGGDTFTEQGFTGSFSYTVASGPFIGSILLSGTFGVSGTPANSGGALSEVIGGSGGSYSATQTGPNPTGVVMNSAFLDFTGVGNEAASWAFSAGAPPFAVDPTASTLSKPATGVTFMDNHSDTFSSEPAPGGQSPEPATMGLLGSALVGLGLAGRKRFSR